MAASVPAGLYDVYLGSDARNFVDTFTESVIAGMKDVVDTGLDVSGGTISLDITISNEPGVIDGVVTDDKGEAIPNATVVAVPDPKLRKNLYRYYPTATDQAGHFVLRGIRPGEYKLLAWTGLDGDEYFDPDFLTPFESRGTVAKVEKGTHQTVPLKVIPAPQDQQ
jgi:Carboxypeptidase regulatory-like domain